MLTLWLNSRCVMSWDGGGLLLSLSNRRFIDSWNKSRLINFHRRCFYQKLWNIRSKIFRTAIVGSQLFRENENPFLLSWNIQQNNNKRKRDKSFLSLRKVSNHNKRNCLIHHFDSPTHLPLLSNLNPSSHSVRTSDLTVEDWWWSSDCFSSSTSKRRSS